MVLEEYHGIKQNSCCIQLIFSLKKKINNILNSLGIYFLMKSVVEKFQNKTDKGGGR